jgi:molybdopterin/thiamine biosynthesis adenylyltransferase/rhodanese-related sulfurtransferase
MTIHDLTQAQVNSKLSESERTRFDRQIKLPNCGLDGQLRLKESTIAVIGAGGLGCASLTSLVMTGIGRILIFDFDTVSLSNLHRQSLYRECDVDRLKVEVAVERLHALNPWSRIEGYAQPLRRYSALSDLKGVDLILDCTDRFSARANIAAICQELNTPHVYGSVSGRDGQIALFNPNHSCFRCLFPNLPTGGVIQSCDQGGVLGVTPQVIGSMQAQLAIDYLLSERMSTGGGNRLHMISTSPLQTHQLNLSRLPSCPLCSINHHDQIDKSLEPFPIPISVHMVMNRLKRGWMPAILDVRTPKEYVEGHLLKALNLESDELLSLFETDGLSHKYHELMIQGDLLVYCQRGPRAEKVAKAIHAYRISYHRAGVVHGNVYELVGGYSGWRDHIK